MKEQGTTEWVTSDVHLGHGNILLYCKRPWLRDGDWYKTDGDRPAWVSGDIKDARTNEMNEAMVRSWNEVVNPGDTVKHIGDFCFTSSKQRRTPADWEARLNGKIVHFKGNHDRSRDIKGMLTSATMKAGGYEMLLIHRPPARIEEIPDFCDVVLCGHVHEAWDHKWVGNILILNVGVDVRGFKPWRMDAVVGEVEKLKRQR